MQKRNRKREWMIFAISVVAATAIMLGLVELNIALRRNLSEGTPSGSDLALGVLIDDIQWEGRTARATITAPKSDWSFLYLKNARWSQIKLNGEIEKEANSNRISNLWLKPGKTYELEVSPAYGFEGYIVRANMYDIVYKMTDRLSWASLALYVVLVINTLSLYTQKRSEKYLIDFCAYLVVMVVWTLCIAMPNVFNEMSMSTVLFSLLAMFSVRICKQLTKPVLPKWLNWFTGWGFWPCCAALIVFRLGYHGYAHNGVLLALFLLAMYVLACAVAQGRRDSHMLLAAMTILTGMRPSLMMFDYSIFGQESFWCYIVRTQMRVHDLIFILAAMLFVNREFAWQFAEKERLAVHLDELVQERTQKLMDAQRQRQSMMLNIFHDVRTPLAVMRGALDTIEANPDSTGTMLSLISSRLSFVTELTGDLFLTAKLEDGQVMLTCNRVDLSALVREQGEQANRLAQAAHIRLHIDVKPGMIVWGEPMRLAQIGQNLLTNAIHYTPAGGDIWLTLQCEGEEAVLRVRDSGKGISPEDQLHIFDRYFHTTAENKHESSGLGLTIARDLTTLHRGTLVVESALGEGTTFIARFPLLPDEPA